MTRKLVFVKGVARTVDREFNATMSAGAFRYLNTI